MDDLQTHLLLLPDVIKQGTPRVKKVTSVCTVCEAMNAVGVFKSMLSEVHKLVQHYLTISVTSASQEVFLSIGTCSNTFKIKHDRAKA